MPKRTFAALLVLQAIAGVAACESASSSSSGSLPDAGGTEAGVDATPTTDGPPPTDSASDAATNDAGNDASGDASDASDAGQSPGALHFNGAGLVSLPAAAGAANETAFTWEVWFRTTAQTGMLVEVYGAGADRSVYLKDGTVCFYVYTPAYSELCSTMTYNDGAWHHAAGVLGASGQRLYVDGAVKQEAAGVTASAFSSDSAFRAGYGYIGPNGPLTYFTGDIDEIRLWNVARTANEIASDRAKVIAPSTPGLQGYWRLDETGTSTTAADLTTGANNGTLQNLDASPWISPGAF